MKKLNKKVYWLISVLSVCCVILIWFICCDILKLTKNAVFPSVSRVVKAFINKMTSTKPDGATLPEHLLSSLRVCLLGYGIGAVIGIPLGILMAWNKWCDRLIRPVFDLIRPIPGIAWIPLFILIFGIGIGSKAMVIFLNSLIACTINAYTGIQQTDELHLWVSDVFGATNMQKLFKVAIPTATPMIFTGLRTALGTSWTALVAAELLASSKGLGFMIQQARAISRPDIIIVGMLSIGFVGLVLDVILHAIEKKVAKGMFAK